MAEQRVEEPHQYGEHETCGKEVVVFLDLFRSYFKIGYDITPEQECHYRGAHEVESVGCHVEFDHSGLVVDYPAYLVQESRIETAEEKEQIDIEVCFVLLLVDNAADEQDISQCHTA